MKSAHEENQRMNQSLNQEVDNNRVMARQISRELNREEIIKISGAAKCRVRKCDDTDNGGFWTELDCWYEDKEC